MNTTRETFFGDMTDKEYEQMQKEGKANIQKRLARMAIKLGCDERVPASASGPISDLTAPNATVEIINDRVQRLAKYAPDVVDSYWDTSKNI